MVTVRSLSRRSPAILAGMMAGLAILNLVPAAAAEDMTWRHASSLIGTPKYPADFQRFDYVNPEAPKGGEVRISANDTFDTLNPLLARSQPGFRHYVISDGYRVVIGSQTSNASYAK